jgi:type III secretion protein D
MKRLRVLTGKHVGAHLDLSDGTHLVGSSSECDINITDWTFAPLELVVSGEAVMCCWRQPGKAPTAEGEREQIERSVELENLEPREFDGIVLCAGPVDEEWPSDVHLLSAVFAPGPKRVARWAKRRFAPRLLHLGLAAAVVSTVAIAWPLMAFGPPPAAELTIEERRAMLQRALEQVTGDHLVATIEQRTIYVSGMAENGEEAEAGRAAIRAHRGPYMAVPRFSVATEIAETIRSTAGLTNPTVRHVGGGAFSVVADVTDERTARASLDRMGADLAPAVKRITATFEKIYPSDPLGPILSRSQQEGLSVVQTRDGVRHLVMRASVAPLEPPAPALKSTRSRVAKPLAKQPRTSALTSATTISPKGATP